MYNGLCFHWLSRHIHQQWGYLKHLCLFSCIFSRWVHVVCALYVPGVAFGDIDKLRPVTLTEMNYSKYGAKASTNNMLLYVSKNKDDVNRVEQNQSILLPTCFITVEDWGMGFRFLDSLFLSTQTIDFRCLWWISLVYEEQHVKTNKMTLVWLVTVKLYIQLNTVINQWSHSDIHSRWNPFEGH